MRGGEDREERGRLCINRFTSLCRDVVGESLVAGA